MILQPTPCHKVTVLPLSWLLLPVLPLPVHKLTPCHQVPLLLLLLPVVHMKQAWLAQLQSMQTQVRVQVQVKLQVRLQMQMQSHCGAA
jgi:hypothetical protein